MFLINDFKNASKAIKKILNSNVINKNKIIKGTSQATWKKLLKSFGRKLPLAGAILGINEVANAVEMGVTNPVDLFAAYQISADAALEGKRYREDPEFRKQSIAKTLSIPLDEGTYDAIDNQSTFGKYNDQVKNIKLPEDLAPTA